MELDKSSQKLLDYFFPIRGQIVGQMIQLIVVAQALLLAWRIHWEELVGSSGSIL